MERGNEIKIATCDKNVAFHMFDGNSKATQEAMFWHKYFQRIQAKKNCCMKARKVTREVNYSQRIESKKNQNLTNV